MIYTVTLNPALDIVLTLHEPCRVGALNRAVGEKYSIGGKGINVSRVLKVLKRESIALGLVGSYVGEFLEISLKQEDIKTDFVWIKGDTRTDIKVVDNNKVETSINAPGPIINKEDVMNLAKKLAKIKKEDIVVISGGLPKSLSLNTFDSFVKLISTKDIYLVVNIYSSALLKIIKYKPFLVDLNESELADTLFTRVGTDDDCVKGARHLLKLGAKNVLITRGDKGAIFVNDEMTIKAKAIKGEVKNTVGAGDSLLAAFIDEYIKTESFEKAIKKGVIVGSATAFSDGLANEKTIAELSK